MIFISRALLSCSAILSSFGATSVSAPRTIIILYNYRENPIGKGDPQTSSLYYYYYTPK